VEFIFSISVVTQSESGNNSRRIACPFVSVALSSVYDNAWDPENEGDYDKSDCYEVFEVEVKRKTRA